MTERFSGAKERGAIMSRKTDDKCAHLCEELQAHLIQDASTRAVLTQLSGSVRCLKESMEEYQKPLQQLVVMLPEIKEVLTRNSQAKAIFWFIVILSAAIASLVGAIAAIASAVDWAISHLNFFKKP